MKLLEVGIGDEMLVEREIENELLPATAHLDADRHLVQVVSVVGVISPCVRDLCVFAAVEEPRPRHRVPRELCTRHGGGGARGGVLRGQDQELAAEEQERRRRRYRGHLRSHLAQDHGETMSVVHAPWTD